MKDIENLIAGYRKFYQHYFIDDGSVYKKLAAGQSPRAVMIACSDSRVDPSLITDSQPGEIFVIRNVANLIPPYQRDNKTYHGTSAALEFAINILKVPNVIVFGHSKCAGIRALLDDSNVGAKSSFVKSWMRIAEDVKKEVKSTCGHMSIAKQAHQCEKKAIEKSLSNLMTFPWIKEKVKDGELSLHGWHFDIDKGILSLFNNAGKWKKLEHEKKR